MGFENAKILIAIKIPPEEAKKLDRSKMAVGRPAPSPKDVEGQIPYMQFIMCPWCGAGGWVAADTDVHTWFTCWNCGYSSRPKV